VGNIPVLCGPHPGHHRPDLPGQLVQEGHQPHQLAGIGSYIMGWSHENRLCHFECMISSMLYVVSVMDPVLDLGNVQVQYYFILEIRHLYFTTCRILKNID
jgi:hypothetical protein